MPHGGARWSRQNPRDGSIHEPAMNSIPSPAARVTALDPLDRKGRRVRVILDQGDPLELALEVVERAGLGASDPVDEALRARLCDDDLRWRTREVALAHLARRPRSREETRRRLRAKNFPAPVIEACLDELVAEALLDDDAFADALIRERLRRTPRGPALIRNELCRRGLTPSAAAAAVTRGLQGTGTSDEALAVEVALRWLKGRGERNRGALAGGDRPARARGSVRRLGHASPRAAAVHRLSTFLRTRGFGAEAVRAGVSAAEAAARADPRA